MPDDNDKKTHTDAVNGPEAPERKHIADPFAKLTDADWIEAFRVGKLVADARDERIGAGIRGGYENSIKAELGKLDEAELALQTYLQRPDSEPEDLQRHCALAEDLKKVIDDLKKTMDEYAVLVSNRLRASGSS
jgi:hypothetical protein